MNVHRQCYWQFFTNTMCKSISFNVYFIWLAVSTPSFSCSFYVYYTCILDTMKNVIVLCMLLYNIEVKSVSIEKAFATQYDNECLRVNCVLPLWTTGEKQINLKVQRKQFECDYQPDHTFHIILNKWKIISKENVFTFNITRVVFEW